MYYFFNFSLRLELYENFTKNPKNHQKVCTWPMFIYATSIPKLMIMDFLKEDSIA